MSVEFLIKLSNEETPKKVETTGWVDELGYGLFKILSDLTGQEEFLGVSVTTSQPNNDKTPINFEI